MPRLLLNFALPRRSEPFMFSIAFVVEKKLAHRVRQIQAEDRQRLRKPLPEITGGAGLTVRVKPRRQLVDLLLRCRHRGAVVRVPHLPSDVRTTRLGQMLANVAHLVDMATLHDRARAEHVTDGLAEALAAINDEQHRLLYAKPALDEVVQERRREHRVLGRPPAQTERHPGPVDRHTKCHDCRAFRELDTVDEDRNEVDIIELARHELRELLRSRIDERSARVALARASADEVAIERSETAIVPTRRDADGDLFVSSLAHEASDAAGGVGHQLTDVADDAIHEVSDIAGRVATQTSSAASALVHGARDASATVVHGAEEATSYVSSGVRNQARRVERGFHSTLEENPLALGAAAIALGALVGYALPRTEGEDALMGSARDEVMHRAGGATHEAASFVSHLAEKSVDAAKELLTDATASASKGSPASAG